MKHVFVVFEKTYGDEAAIAYHGPIVSGLIGVFEKKEEAIKIMRQELVKLGMPNDLYEDDSCFTIFVDSDGRWVDDDSENDEFMMVFECKEVELNKSLCDNFD